MYIEENKTTKRAQVVPIRIQFHPCNTFNTNTKLKRVPKIGNPLSDNSKSWFRFRVEPDTTLYLHKLR